MEIREKDGKKFDNCSLCDNLSSVSVGGTEWECTSPKTGYHRYDILRADDSGKVPFPEWCPLLRIDE